MPTCSPEAHVRPDGRAGRRSRPCADAGSLARRAPATSGRRTQPGTQQRGEEGSADRPLIGVLRLPLDLVGGINLAVGLIRLECFETPARSRHHLDGRPERGLRATCQQG